MLERDTNSAGPIVDSGTDDSLNPESPDLLAGSRGQETGTPGSAIPRPASTLEFPTKGKIGKFTVSLLDDIEMAPRLEDVERINSGSKGEARTPLMTVILAVLAKHGGSMRVEELAVEVGRYWNRPWPASPYSAVEFIYSIARSSDSVSVR